MYDRKELRKVADQYCDDNRILVCQQLGFGTQGVVFFTERLSAIKVHARNDGYSRERDVYLRLRDRSVDSVQGLTVPRLLHWDDGLRVLEMSVVHVPCILDFGGTYLDIAPPHMCRDDQWQLEKAEEFGANWERAQSVIREIEHRAAIWLSDVNIGNIKLE